MRAARIDRHLKLSDIVDYSPSHLSRVERNHMYPTESIVRAYVKATGESGLAEQFERLAAKAPPPAVLDGQASYFANNYVVEQFESVVRVGTTVRVVETRTVRMLVPGQKQITIRQGLFRLNGRSPKILSLEGTRAHVESLVWLGETYFALNIEFASELALDTSHRFTIDYEFDVLYPRYTYQPLVEARFFHLTLILPDRGYQVAEIRGEPQILATDHAEAFLGGNDSVIPAAVIDGHNNVEYEISRPVTGLAYGLVWRKAE